MKSIAFALALVAALAAARLAAADSLCCPFDFQTACTYNVADCSAGVTRNAVQFVTQGTAGSATLTPVANGANGLCLLTAAEQQSSDVCLELAASGGVSIEATGAILTGPSICQFTDFIACSDGNCLAAEPIPNQPLDCAQGDVSGFFAIPASDVAFMGWPVCTPSCAPGSCNVADGCGGTCGCASGDVCISNDTCCTPANCAQENAACGVIQNNCNQKIDCGPCPAGFTCDTKFSNQCVPAAKVPAVAGTGHLLTLSGLLGFVGASIGHRSSRRRRRDK